MIDTRKVRLMAKLSMYEKNEGKKDLKINKYTRGTWQSLKAMEALIVVTVAFAVCVVLYMAKIYTDLLSAGLSLPVMGSLLPILGIYLILAVFTIIIARSMAGKKYDMAKDRIDHYERQLAVLNRHIEKAEEQVYGKTC